MMALVGHGQGGTCEPVVSLLRSGRAATNDAQDQITVLDALAVLQHRLRTRAEYCIRNLKDTGATNLPLQSFDKNQIWLASAAWLRS